MSETLSLELRALFSLHKRNVKVSSSKYKGCLEGKIVEFWIDNLYADRVNFHIQTKNGIVKHGIDKPVSFEDLDTKFVFYTKNDKYEFELL